MQWCQEPTNTLWRGQETRIKESHTLKSYNKCGHTFDRVLLFIARANPVLNLNIDTAIVLGLDEETSDVDKVRYKTTHTLSAMC